MKNFLNKIANYRQKALTFLLNYDTLNLEYIGIVVYFGGLKSVAKLSKLTRQNKKQNKTIYQLLAGQHLSGISAFKTASIADQLNSDQPLSTFCFLSKRFFIKRSSAKKLKIKSHIHDSGLLSITRHFAENRSQQNDFNSLGRGGIDTQSFTRQSRLALLYQRTSRRNYSSRSGHQLLPRNVCRSTRLQGTHASESFEPSVKSLKFLLFTTAKYVLVETKQNFHDWLETNSSRFTVYIRPLTQTKCEINIQSN